MSSHCVVFVSTLFHITWSAFLPINSQTTPSDLICTNAETYEGCIINCFHNTNTYQRMIDCQDASICILNITAESCANGAIINATNTDQFGMYITSDNGAESSEIYLSMKSIGSVYIEAADADSMLLNAHIYGNNARNISLHCKGGITKECSGVTLDAENVKYLDIHIYANSAINVGVIYCPANGSCLIDVQNDGHLTNSDIFAAQGINNLDSSSVEGLQMQCTDSYGSSCEFTRVRCGFNYTTYSVLKRYAYASNDWRWDYGDCSTLYPGDALVGNYDSNWYYVFGDDPSDQQLVCPPNLLDLGYVGCKIHCIYHSGVDRNLECGDGLCVINYENGCDVDSIDVKNASNTTINVIYSAITGNGPLFVGSTISDDTRINCVVMNCYSGCSVRMNFELVDYLEINVFDSIYVGNGQLKSSAYVYCPTTSNITPSCVINCNSGSECSNAHIYSVGGIPRDLSLNCDDQTSSICINIDIQCGLGPFYNKTMVQPKYDSNLGVWEYSNCFNFTDAPTSMTAIPTTTPTKNPTPNQTIEVIETTAYTLSTTMYTTLETFFTDFTYTFDNIGSEVYVNINKSLDLIEDIVNDLYDDNPNIEYDKIEMKNKNNLMYDSNNNSVTIIIRVVYEIIYEKQIINYTQSDEYKEEFIQETRKQLNDTTITVTIIKYINQANSTQATREKKDEFIVDYTEKLFIVILIINAVTILLALASYIESRICKHKTDSAKPFVLILFGLRLTDIITDLNVGYVLWIDYLKNNKDNTLLLVLCILCLIFLFVPWIVNIYSISVIRKKMANNRRTSVWFSRYNNATFFLILVILTGDAFFALQVISSYVFGIQRLDAGISEKLDIDQFRIIKVFGVVCLENVPQLIIAAIYAFTIEKGNDSVITVAVLSMIISVISIFICTVSWCLMKASQKAQSHQMIKYTIAMNLSSQSINKEEEKKRIMKRMGFKQTLRNDLSLTIGAEKDQLEVVYTSITNEGANIDVVQFIHNTEMQMNNSNTEGFVTNKYCGNENETNAILQKHFKLNHGVTHKILFNNMGYKKEGTHQTDTKLLQENEMVNVLSNEEKDNESTNDYDDDDDAKLEQVMDTPQ